MADTVLIRDDQGTEEVRDGDRVIRPASGAWPKGAALEIQDYVSGKTLRRADRFYLRQIEAEGIDEGSPNAGIIQAQSLLAHVIVDAKGSIYRGPSLKELQGTDDDKVQARFDAIDEGLALYAVTYAVGEINRLANGPLAPSAPAKN